MKPDDTSQTPDDSLWAVLVPCILHPVQREIIEALWQSDRPLTSKDLSEVVEGARLATINRHLRRLLKLNVVDYAEEPTRLNVYDIPIAFVRSPADES
ncbi:MAG: winged helix-turn-helix domain-containing protein [Solirubrobacterales bacterium]